MSYLDEPEKEYIPPQEVLKIHSEEEIQQKRDAMWNAFGHKKISKDFSSDPTPQEREDNKMHW